MVSGPTFTEPEVAPPVANPEPEHDVALVDDHVSVTGFALRKTDAGPERFAVGAAGGLEIP